MSMTEIAAESATTPACDAIPLKDRRWSWVEIDLSAIEHNAADAKKQLPEGCKLMAVVKGDGYGHGDIQSARAAIAGGAEYLGVATVHEGAQLRKKGVGDIPMMVIAQPPAESVPLLLEYQIYPATYSVEFARAYGEAAQARGMKAPIHVAVNTGMNRIGVKWSDLVEFRQAIAEIPAIEVAGTFTHFATADCPAQDQFYQQVERFKGAIAAVREAGFDTGLVHAANSASIWRYPEVHFDMVRLGISLFGFVPCPEVAEIADLQPAMSVHARISAVRTVEPGDGVSYGLHYYPEPYERICTVPLGYADGLHRALSSRTDFIYDGKRVPQTGNICMDQCMFSVDARPDANGVCANPQVGDEVIIMGKMGDAAVTADELAAKLDTIVHEISIPFAMRMPRYYV